ncbi:DUF4433 domain-containing protein [Xanthobacteraceae bacterium A53D]
MLAAKHGGAIIRIMLKHLTPENAYIFRIVHVDNIIPVLQRGCICRRAAEAERYVEIGNPELIQKRIAREVPVAPGGTLSDYVPFYFTPYSPMLYNIKTGYNGVQKQEMDKIVILISSLRKISSLGLSFVFSDRHAYLRTAQFSNSLLNLGWIAWDALQEKNFRKDNLERFEKYQAEALVHQSVPIPAFLAIACYSEQVKTLVSRHAAECAPNAKIITRTEWFL